ncbi:MAG: hypothetical protein LAO31_20795 [Acidobacteriia bacterium]|nr:hypothetical protein [Terriglobia bacterium]
MLFARKHLVFLLMVIFTITLLVYSAVSFAQMGAMRGPSIAGLFHPKVGAGAAYEVTDPKGQKSEMEISVVGQENVGGTPAYWLEMSFTGGPSTGSVMKYLMATQGEEVHVYRMIMKSPQMRAMEMPEAMMSRINEGVTKGLSTSERSMGKNLGTEVVMTKVGPKRCTHWQSVSESGTSDSWVNMDVYPNAMVKSISKTADGTHTTELIRTITDARTKITEEPQKMNLPKMPPR